MRSQVARELWSSSAGSSSCVSRVRRLILWFADGRAKISPSTGTTRTCVKWDRLPSRVCVISLRNEIVRADFPAQIANGYAASVISLRPCTDPDSLLSSLFPDEKKWTKNTLADHIKLGGMGPIVRPLPPLSREVLTPLI